MKIPERKTNPRRKNLRRYIAGALINALLLGMVLPVAGAVDSDISGVTAAKPGEKPQIRIESNAVIDDFGDLTGYLEVAVHVKTPTLEGQTTPEKFRYLGVSLAYNSDILTPVDWTAPDGITTNDVDLSTTTPDSYKEQVRFQTLKNNDSTTAVAHVSGPGAADTDIHSGLFYIISEATKPADYTKDTVVAVVRFRYDKSKYQPWKDVNADQWTDRTSATWLVQFAPDAVSGLVSDGSFVGQQLLYRSENNAFYYTEDPNTTCGKRVEAIDAPLGQEHLTNLLTRGDKQAESDADVRFTLENLPTYDAAMRSNFATILYYDYTDRLMGVQTVLPGDARVAINTYVERNFIYPDLRASAHKGDANYTDSIERQYSYRGIYPSIDPENGETVDDGDKYKLTYKLDYTFYKRKTTGEPVDPDGKPNSGDEGIKWTPQKMSEVTDPVEKDLPYIHGWAVIDDLDDIENVWTTFGTGELGNCDPASGSFTTTGESSYFRFADFSHLENGQVIYVKACYEPGPLLKHGFTYDLLTEPYYERYGGSATPVGGVYSISFSYGRVNAGYGVSRMRDPSVRIDYVPDVEGIAQLPFSVGQEVENEDIIAVTFTPSSKLMSMTYMLQDRKPYMSYLDKTKDYNFFTGAARSLTGNPANIMENFNYTEFHYEDGEFLGSKGFVTEATLNQILKITTEASQSPIRDMTDVNGYINSNTLIDANLRSDFSGKNFSTSTLSIARNLLVNAAEVAVKAGKVDENGVADLDWHHLQYHLINATYDPVTGKCSGGLNDGIPDEKNWGAYFWCRLDDCAGGSLPITNLQELLVAVLDYIGVNATGTPNDRALNQLTGMFELRTGITAVPFADLNAFKTAIVSAIRNLSQNGASADDIKAMTWKQVQYILDRPSTTIPGTVTEDYWWENGGSKSIDSLATLLDIAKKIRNNGYHDSWLGGLTLERVEELKLRDENDGTAYTDVEKFKTDLKNIIDTLPDVTTATALEVQHLLLGNPYVDHATLEAMNDAGTINYWWLITPTPTDYASLLALAWQVYSSASTADEALLEKATVALVTNGGDDGTADFWLRGAETGAPFVDEDALKAALRYAVTALEAQGVTDATLNTVTWAQFQNLLIGNPYDANPDPTGEKFWWHNGGHRPITNLQELLEAAWNTYGNPSGDGSTPEGSTDEKAIDYLTDAHLTFVNGVESDPAPENYLYFRNGVDGAEYTAIADFKAALKEAVIKLVARNPQQSYTAGRSWIEIQHLLLGNSFRSEAALRGDKEIDYWWEAGGSKPVPSDMDYTWANDVIGTLTAKASAVTNEGGMPSAADILPLLTDEVVDALNIQDGSGNKLTKNELAEKIVEAEANAWGDGYAAWEGYMDEEYCMRLPWKVFQQYVVDGSYKLDENISEFSWTPVSVKYEAANTCVAQLTAYASSITNDGGVPEASNIEPLLSDAMVTALNLKDSAGNRLTKTQIAEKIVEVEANAWADGYDVCEGYMDSNYCMNLPWKTVQQYILDGSFKKQENIKSFMWFPANDTPSPALYSMRMLSAMVASSLALPEEPSAPETEETTETETSEDGLTQTTKHILTTRAADGSWTTVATTTVVTTTETLVITTTTVVTTTYDPVEDKVSTTTTSDTVLSQPEAPEEPTCTCGSEDGTHAEDCPLYVDPGDAGTDDPVGPECTCGSEDGTHAEDCPLYVAPEVLETPEEPVCTCGNEDGTHSSDCPLYMAPDEDLTDPEVPGTGTPEPDPKPELEEPTEPTLEEETEEPPAQSPEKTPEETPEELLQENTGPTEGREDIMARLRRSEKWNRSGLGRLLFGTVWRSRLFAETGRPSWLESFGMVNLMERGEAA